MMKKYLITAMIAAALLMCFCVYFIFYVQFTAYQEAQARSRQFKILKSAHAIRKIIKLDPKFIPSTMVQGIPLKLDQFSPSFKDAKELDAYYLVKTSKGLVFYHMEPDSAYYLERLEHTSTLQETLNLTYDLSIGTTTDTWKLVIIQNLDKDRQSTQTAKSSLNGLRRYDDSAFPQ